MFTEMEMLTKPICCMFDTNRRKIIDGFIFYNTPSSCIYRPQNPAQIILQVIFSQGIFNSGKPYSYLSASSK